VSQIPDAVYLPDSNKLDQPNTSPELPTGLKFHIADHTLHPTRGAVASANRISISENISEHDRELLITAAYFHDSGYIRKYNKNEPIGAEMAGRILKLFGYKPNEIVKVQKMILSTDLEREPKTHLEKILRDADLDHFSRKDFFKLDGKLREEFRAQGIDVRDEEKWYSDAIELITTHQYYNESQKKLREKRKQKNIRCLLRKLKNIGKKAGAKNSPLLFCDCSNHTRTCNMPPLI